jgi:hypothetical protein
MTDIPLTGSSVVQPPVGARGAAEPQDPNGPRCGATDGAHDGADTILPNETPAVRFSSSLNLLAAGMDNQ